MHNIIFSSTFGSHLYGTNVETSDLDYKAIRLPTKEEILLSKIKKTINSTTKTLKGTKNSSEDVDTEIFTLDQYLKLLCEGQAVAIDMFFTPQKFINESNDIWIEVKKHQNEWLHSDISPYVGYCRQQANKYGIKGSRVSSVRSVLEFFKMKESEVGTNSKLKEYWSELELISNSLEHCELSTQELAGQSHIVRMFDCCNRKVQEHATTKEAIKIYQRIFDEYGKRALEAENNENVDWKALMHAVRICNEAIELLNTQNIVFPRPEKDLLLKIRKAELPYKQVAEMIEQGWKDLEVAMKTTKLKSKPNLEFRDKFICDVYESIITKVPKKIKPTKEKKTLNFSDTKTGW